MAAVRDRIGRAAAPVQRIAAPLQARVRALLEGMTPRDRMLLYGLVIAGVVVLSALGVLALRGNLDRLQDEIETREGQLAMVEQMRAEWMEGQQTLSTLEERIKVHENTSLSAFLEKSAERVSLRDNLKQVKETSTSTTDTLEERQYQVTLSRVTLDQLVGFLYEVETAGYPLRVLSTKVKTVVVSGQTLLDVTFEIASFKLLDAGSKENAP